MQKNSSFKDSLASWFSIKDVFTVRSTVVMGMMVALSVVLDQFSIYLTPTFKAIGFSYLPGVMVALLYGPWAALTFGFVTDTVGFLINSHGSAYFGGYAISAMISNLIYACLLYNRPVSIQRVAIARALVIILVGFGLNFVWSSVMYGTGASKYFSTGRFINNVVQFPFHVLLTTFVCKYLLKMQSSIPLLRR